MLLYRIELLFIIYRLVLDIIRHTCSRCGRKYIHYWSLMNHKNYECGKEPKFKCPLAGCDYRCKLKGNLKTHLKGKHRMTEDKIKTLDGYEYTSK